MMNGYPQKYETTAVFKNGLRVNFRAIRPTDAALLEELFYSHSAQTIAHRYFAPIRRLSAELLQKFVTPDYRDDFALIGLLPFENRERMICVGRYFRNPNRDDAEIAVTVHDDFQNCGIGTFLVQALAKIARENGLRAFTASVLADNPAMLHIFRKAAREIEIQAEADSYQVRFGI